MFEILTSYSDMESIAKIRPADLSGGHAKLGELICDAGFGEGHR